ncbi:MAG: Ig-like domain-containing protein [Firmicutes bacterium]|nr:Ig-like domain-containing protein [Bacillota bacterium]
MKRVLSLVLALVLVLGMIPTFAADMTAGQHLYEHEFIAGVGAGELNEAGLLTREQLAKLILELNGSKEEAEVLTLPPSYTDSAKISAWARPYVAYAQIEGLMVGFTDGSFRPQAGVSGQQLAQVLTRALGYEFTWATVVADAADLGIDVATGAALTRGEAFEAMWTAVNTKVKDSELTLGQELGKLELPPAPVALAVESVTAINAKQVLVTFNTTVDKAKAEAVANYDVNLSAALSTDVFTTAAAGAKADLQADGKSVVLTLNTGSQFVNYTTNNKVVVKKEVGLAANATMAAVALTDTTVPTLLSAVATGSNVIELTFSEPVTSPIAPTNIVLNDGTVAINLAGATYDVSGHKMTFSTYTNLINGTNYTVKISAGTNVVDYVGYTVVPSTATFAFAADTTAPTYTVKESNETSVTIVFNKTVTQVVNNASIRVTHTYNNATNQVTGTAITNPSGDNKTFVITFANPLPPGQATVYMSYATGTAASAKIKDNYGNVADLANVTVNTVADVTAPTATVEMKAGSNDTIYITFSESVTGATSASNFTLKKGTSNVAFGAPTLVSGNKYQMVASAPLSGDYVVGITAGIKDTSIAQNAFVATTFNLTVADAIKPFITAENNTTAGSNFFTQADAKKVRIYFSEAMDNASLVDLTKYQNVSDNYANPTSAQVSADGKSVYLVFENNVAGNLIIGTVKDAAGNLIAGLGATLTTSAGSNVGLLATSASLPDVVFSESTTTAKVYLNDLVTGLTTADFEVYNGTEWVAPATFSIDNASGKTVVTLIIPTNKEFDKAATGVQVRTVSAPATQGSTANAKNAFGKPVNIAATNVADYMAPEVAKVVYLSPTKIQVYFDEALNTGTVSLAGTNGFSVVGGSLTKAVMTSDSKVIELTGSSFTSATDVAYNGTAGILDANDNALAAFSKTSDLTGATITVVNAVADNTFTVTTNFIAAIIDVADIDMDVVTAGVNNTLLANGVTYTVTDDNGGTVTITATGNATATQNATTTTFTITLGTVTKTVTMGIPAATATQAGGQPTVAGQ